MRSLAEVPDVARQFVEQIRRGTGVWFCLPQGMVYILEFFLYPKTPLHRAGCTLVVFGGLTAGIGWLMDRRRLKNPSEDDVYQNPLACAFFYRAELMRHLSTLWVQVLALGCYAAGSMLTNHAGFREVDSFTVLIGFIWATGLLVGFSRWRLKTARRIEGLDALLNSTAE